jgi:hypothetical protein
MKCYKGLLLLLFSISFAQLNAQQLKRKYRGIYEGQIPSYDVKMGTSTYPVGTSKIKVFLDQDSTLEKTKENLIITVNRDQSGIAEQLRLDPKTKIMIRKGLYPQPDARLTRTGKLPRR